MNLLVKIFKGQYLHRLDNIHQWQDRFTFQQESVAQHSYKVAVFAQLINYYLFEGNHDKPEVKNFRLTCIENALLHDFDESILLRDMSHETKYNAFNGQSIRNAIDAYVEHQLQEELVGNYKQARYPEKRFFVCVMGSELPGVYELVKVCDWLALLFFINEEIRIGNVEFTERRDYCVKCLLTAVNKLEDSLRKTTLFESVNVSWLNDFVKYFCQS